MNPNPASQQQFTLRWKFHNEILGTAFPRLLARQRFVDVTLACEGHQLHCHRLVLAASSAYFESLLSENPSKHAIVIIPDDIKFRVIQAFVDFMYNGEVNIPQAGLTDFLKCAARLQIRGLYGAKAEIAKHPILSIKVANNRSLTTVDGVPQFGVTSPTAEIATGGASTIGAAITTLNAATAGAGGINTVTTALPASSSLSAASLSSSLMIVPPTFLSAANLACSHSNSALNPPGGGARSNLVLMSCQSPSNQQFSTSTPNTSAILTPKLEPVDGSINNVVDLTKTDREEAVYFTEHTEAILRQAAEFVINGYTFETVSVMFNIPVLAIRLFMTRKGILIRRKRRADEVSTNGGTHSEFS